MPESQPTRARRRASFGAYELDLYTGELRKHGVRLKLQQQPFQILAALLEQPGELVTREQLRDRLWPDGTFVDFEHGLNAAMQKLRDTLNDPAADPRYIETLPKRGYRFICEARLEAAGNEKADEPLAPPGSAESTSAIGGSAMARGWFATLQLMYLIFYIVTLVRFEHIGEGLAQALWLGSSAAVAVILTTALVGIAVRLFFLFGFWLAPERSAKTFFRSFPGVALLDELWAVSPFLIERQLGIGMALACTVALAWSPFAQRTLLRMGLAKPTR